MAEYLIQETTLDAIADAINAKTGGSSAMTPAEMVTAIGSIQTGGGGEWTTDGLADGSEPSGNLTINSTDLFPGAFNGRKNIREVVLSKYVNSVNSSVPYPANVFRESGITSFIGEKNTGTGQYWFYNCVSLVSVVAPKADYLEFGTFQGASALSIVDVNGATGISRGSIFSGCKALQTLILRSQSICNLSNVNNFTNTPFNGTGNAGLTGTLYVPNSLVESYKSASNWSTFYNRGTMAVLPIEGSIYETQYADGTPIPSE